MNCQLVHILLLGLAAIFSFAVATEQPRYTPTHALHSGRTSFVNKLNDRSRTNAALNRNSNPNKELEEVYDALKTLADPENVKQMSQSAAAAIGEMLSQLNMTSQCANDTARIVTHLSNRAHWNRTDWAVQMIDSVGKPGPSLTELRLNWVGNYRQCRTVRAPENPELHSKGFRGSYTDVIIGLGDPYSPFTAKFQWGLCFPDSCSAGEIYVMVNKALDSLSLPVKPLVYMPDIRTDQREYTTATYLAIVILSIIASLMIIGTTYDVIFIQRNKWAAQKQTDLSITADTAQNGASPNTYTVFPSEPSPRDTKFLISDVRDTGEPGTLAKAILAFSVYTNTSKFLNTRQAEGSLGAIHGIRFLSMSWVILGHIYFFGATFFINSAELLPLFQRWTFDAVANALVSVDTFFTLSGLLTSYLVIKQMKKKTWKINWGLFYFHRFWRLTPPYMLTLLLVLGLQRFFGSGSEWATVQPQDKDFCEKNWWTNLLYINNLYDIKQLCFGHTWYMANDMQFFVLSPLMIIPLYFNKLAGLASCALILLGTIATTAYLSVKNNWPAAIMGGISVTTQSVDFLGFMRDYYFPPWCRIGPFVVGIAVGYFLAIHKGRIPLNRTVNVIGWVIATAVGLACVYGLDEEVSGTLNSVGVDAFYNSCARSLWSACVCWVIVSCTSGYGGFVNTILSWSPFVALGRLTYMAYLIHPSILSIYFQNMDQPFYVNDLNIIVTYLGILVLTNVIAFVLMLGLESPMIGLEKIFLSPKKE